CSCPTTPFPSFPTRRSSDLADLLAGRILVAHRIRALLAVEFLAGLGIGQRLPAIVRTPHRNRLVPRRRTGAGAREEQVLDCDAEDRKSTRLNSSHVKISYAV